MTEPNTTVPRKTVEKLAANIRERDLLEDAAKRTMAIMIRACVKRLHSPDKDKHHAAFVYLTGLAEMLERQAGPEPVDISPPTSNL